MAKPIIGISGPDRGGQAAWWFAALAIRLQGGRARRIRPSHPFDPLRLDGLIIGGGADISPREKSGELDQVRQAIKSTSDPAWSKWLLYPLIFLMRRLFSLKAPQRYDADRDALETELINHALARQLPLLGICRGAQLINYVLGGTLHEDIHEFYEEAPLPRSIFPVKKVRLEADSLLQRILQRTATTVNALHHQAIDELGEHIRISGREENGLVQAIESDRQPFLIGVQWHPEYLPLERSQRRLFRALVDAAREKKVS